MARVVLVGNLRQFAGVETELKVEAKNVRQLFNELGKRFPELVAHLEGGVCVAIDGVIYQDAWFAEIATDSEVHLMPAFAGG
jgi:molybdopterin converting factor small subunit